MKWLPFLSASKQLTLFLILQHCIFSYLIFKHWSLMGLLISYTLFYFIKGFGSEIGAHRYFTHKSFKTSLLKERFFIVLQFFAGEGSIISFAGVHRLHHRHTDSAKDPHSGEDPWYVTLFWAKEYHFDLVSIRDLLGNRWLYWQHQIYFPLHITILAALLYFSPETYLYAFCIPILLTTYSNALVNIVCHRFGYRNFDTPDKSTNNIWVNLWTMGTGLHNNHHAQPNSYTNISKSSEWDLLGFYIESFFLKKNSLSHSTESATNQK